MRAESGEDIMKREIRTKAAEIAARAMAGIPKEWVSLEWKVVDLAQAIEHYIWTGEQRLRERPATGLEAERRRNEAKKEG